MTNSISEIAPHTFQFNPSASENAGKMVMGHRGASSIAPENTLAAFQLAEDNNVPWIEVDADMLADGTVVICHDKTLDRCSDHTGLLCDKIVTDLDDIDAGAWFGLDFVGERIPTLVDLILFTNETGMNLNLELMSGPDKVTTDRLIDGVIRDINHHWQGGQQLLISSFNHLLLAEIKRRAPEISLACLFEAPLPDDWLTSMQYVGAEFIHPKDSGLTEQQVNAMTVAGYSVNVWTVNCLARANQLYNWGVTGICTDIPQQFPPCYRN
ncbi:glycerophosphoryl diester phosphodiesterase [Moritella viscosa]|nr:glycerophosphoryl diester phosphodiesterase [Moritella viscosa]